ncbi:MAG: hypothetical protein JSW33_13960 [bacterium]|nr:MAG: hypothetical protein JSW33_13960 [bacterium]
MALFGKNKITGPAPHRRISVGEYTLVLNSRGRIPVILAKKNRKSCEVLDLVYMDQEALQISLFTGAVHVYKRSKEQVEELLSARGERLPIHFVKMSQNHRSLLIMIGSGTTSEEVHNGFQEVIWTSPNHNKNKRMPKKSNENDDDIFE